MTTDKEFLDGLRDFYNKTGKGDVSETKPSQTRDGATIADRLKAYYTEPTYDKELEEFVEYVIKNMNPIEIGGKLEKDHDVLKMIININLYFKDYEYHHRDKVIHYIISKVDDILQERTGFSRVRAYNQGPQIELVFVF